MKSRHSQKLSESHSVMSDSLRPHGLYTPWNSPGQNTGVGSLSLLQGIFPTQGSNPGLPRCSRNLYQLSHKGSPRTLEWAACPLSSRSSRPRNQTSKSCIAGRFFTNWAIREAKNKLINFLKRAVIQKMQEVKEGGQRRHSGASGRARCSPSHSCCYKRCLNPQALAQPHSSRPHADQLLSASVRGAWEQMPAKSKAPGPPLTPLPPDPPPHPPSATPHLPRPNRMAG